MHTYFYSSFDGCWIVGTGTPRTSDWYPVSDHNSEEEARSEVSFLNGSPDVQKLLMEIKILTDRIDSLESKIESLEESDPNPYLIYDQELVRLRERMR